MVISNGNIGKIRSGIMLNCFDKGEIHMNGDIAIKRCTITDKMYRGVPKQNYYPFSQAWEQYCQDGFVYGSLVVAHNKYYICVTALCCVNSFINNGIASMIEIEPETIGRNTWLSDTDGKMIFEGDILHVSSGKHKYDFITQVGNRDSFISGLYVDGEFEDGSDWTEVGLAMAEWREEGATIKIVGDKK